jgi:hypothetical protein
MWFAECFFWTLGKEALCRVLNKKHSAKKTLGKEAVLPSAKKKHSAKTFFAECQKNTRQSSFSKHILKP